MRATVSVATTLVIAGVLASGCGPSSETPGGNGPGRQEGANGEGKEPLSKPPPSIRDSGWQPPKPTAVTELPKVIVSDDSLVKLGDALPETMLKDLDGQEKTLSQLFGERLTVVIFWTDEGRTNLSALSSVGLRLEDAPEGVKGVSVYVGEDPQSAKDALPEGAQGKFPTLLDPQRAYFSKIAGGALPRIYILDPDGKILWYCAGFDSGREGDFDKAVKFLFADKNATP